MLDRKIHHAANSFDTREGERKKKPILMYYEKKIEKDDDAI